MLSKGSPALPKGSWDSMTTLENIMVVDGWNFVHRCVILGVSNICVKELVLHPFKPTPTLKYPDVRSVLETYFFYLSDKKICLCSLGGYGSF